MGQVAPEHWNAYFVLSPCVTITSDVSALNEGQHTILPTNGTTVVQVLKEQDFPTTICAGSGILLLAELRINRPLALNTRSEGHVRQRSDELIEDLELQLGDLRTEYMRVRLCYAHSAFPQHEDIEERNGISSLIAQHWGSEKANEAMQKMLSQRSTPRKVANGGGSPIHQKLETPAAATPGGLAHANPQDLRNIHDLNEHYFQWG
ncbi:hypothetical protein CC79DRAFT_1320404 [Sarocladium strictum]